MKSIKISPEGSALQAFMKLGNALEKFYVILPEPKGDNYPKKRVSAYFKKKY